MASSAQSEKVGQLARELLVECRRLADLREAIQTTSSPAMSPHEVSAAVDEPDWLVVDELGELVEFLQAGPRRPQAEAETASERLREQLEQRDSEVVNAAVREMLAGSGTLTHQTNGV